jgi:hypothetical protein
MQAHNHITTVSGTTQTLALFVLALVIGSFISLLVVHFLDTEVNPITDPVSDYGARGHAWFYRIAAIWLGFAGLLTAVMVGDAMFPKPTLTILSLLVFAAARWAITIFPTDLEGEEETSAGRSHLVLAIAAFASIAIAATAFAISTNNDPFWHAQHSILVLLAGFVTLIAVSTGIVRALGYGPFGMIERLLYLAMFSWFSAVALMLLTG